MKYYVLCKECGVKIYINTIAKARYELPYSFELNCYKGHINCYYSGEVWADAGVSSATSGLIIGGLLGSAILGPLGAVSGAVIFARAGLNRDEKEREDVKRFNKS